MPQRPRLREERVARFDPRQGARCRLSQCCDKQRATNRRNQATKTRQTWPGIASGRGDLGEAVPQVDGYIPVSEPDLVLLFRPTITQLQTKRRLTHRDLHAGIALRV